MVSHKGGSVHTQTNKWGPKGTMAAGLHQAPWLDPGGSQSGQLWRFLASQSEMGVENGHFWS